MKILFLSQRVPYPPNRGDKISTWRLVERMSRAHEVHAVAFAHDEADLRAAEVLREEKGIPTTVFQHHERSKKLRSLPLLLSDTPLTLGVYGSRELQRKVDELAGWADMAYAFSSSMSAFLTPHQRLVRVNHIGELDSDKWRQYSERTRFPMSWVYRREWCTLLAFERRIAHEHFENVLCTPLEQRIFQEQIPGASSMVLRNGVDLEAFRPAPERAEPDHLVFTGVMNYYPNVDGCAWFVEEVLPRVRARHPAVRFTIIGAHPTSEVRALERHEGVEVTGFVDSVLERVQRGSVAAHRPRHPEQGARGHGLRPARRGDHLGDPGRRRRRGPGLPRPGRGRGLRGGRLRPPRPTRGGARPGATRPGLRGAELRLGGGLPAPRRAARTVRRRARQERHNPLRTR